MAQGQYDHVVRLESVEDLCDEEASMHLWRWIGRCQLGFCDVRRAPVFRPAEPLATHVHDDAVESGVELGPVAQRWPSFPRKQDRIMDGVL